VEVPTQATAEVDGPTRVTAAVGTQVTAAADTTPEAMAVVMVTVTPDTGPAETGTITVTTRQPDLDTTPTMEDMVTTITVVMGEFLEAMELLVGFSLSQQ